jgi:quaternary ammonium compound-resistance protein SugE
MQWAYLFTAGVFEIIWAVSLKYSESFTKLTPSAICVVTMFLSFYFLSLSLNNLPLGTAYAVWTGIGVLGTAVVGILLFDEPKSLLRLFFLALILSGILGLKLQSKF